MSHFLFLSVPHILLDFRPPHSTQINPLKHQVSLATSNCRCVCGTSLLNYAKEISFLMEIVWSFALDCRQRWSPHSQSHTHSDSHFHFHIHATLISLHVFFFSHRCAARYIVFYLHIYTCRWLLWFMPVGPCISLWISFWYFFHYFFLSPRLKHIYYL